jgi:hypothetical protein
MKVSFKGPDSLVPGHGQQSIRLTECTLAPQPYWKMMPRLPDGHQTIRSRTGRQAGAIIQTSFFIVVLPCNFRRFYHYFLQQLLG